MRDIVGVIDEIIVSNLLQIDWVAQSTLCFIIVQFIIWPKAIIHHRAGFFSIRNVVSQNSSINVRRGTKSIIEYICVNASFYPCTIIKPIVRIRVRSMAHSNFYIKLFTTYISKLNTAKISKWCLESNSLEV